MWINTVRIGLIAVSIYGSIALIGVIYHALRPPLIEIKFDCREEDQSDFPLEVRARCQQLLNRAKNANN